MAEALSWLLMDLGVAMLSPTVNMDLPRVLLDRPAAIESVVEQAGSRI